MNDDANPQRQNSWVVSSAPNTYDAEASLEANGEMDWATKNKFTIGDTVYVYEVIPPKGRGGIVYETRVVATDIPLSGKIDDRKYWAGGDYPDHISEHTRFARLKFINTPRAGVIPLNVLKSYGFTAPQSLAHNLNDKSELLDEIQKRFSPMTVEKKNDLRHPIRDGIVHPEDQLVLDSYVKYYAVAASSVRPKRDGLHVVTLQDGRKVRAQWLGQKALESHAEHNLIKQTTNKGNVRYYSYLSEADGSEVISVPGLYQKISRNIAVSTDEEIADEIADGAGTFDEVSQTLEALSATEPPARIERIVSRIVRDPKVRQRIKEQQKYVCEVCHREPFKQSSGKPYAEADHIKPLGLGGLDTLTNMRCLCAQCHAVITFGSDEVVADLLRQTKWHS